MSPFNTYFSVFAIVSLWVSSMSVECTWRIPEQGTDDTDTIEVYDKMATLDHGSRTSYSGLNQELTGEIKKRKNSFNELNIYLEDSIQDSTARIKAIGKKIIYADELQQANSQLSCEIDKLYKRGGLSSSTISDLKQKIKILNANLSQLKWTSKQIDTEIIDLETKSNAITVKLGALDIQNSDSRVQAESDINNFKFNCGRFLGDGVEVPGTKSGDDFRPGEQDHIVEILASNSDQLRTVAGDNFIIAERARLLALSYHQLRPLYTKAAVQAYDARKLYIAKQWLFGDYNKVTGVYTSCIKSYDEIAGKIENFIKNTPDGMFSGCENLSKKGYFAIYKTLADAAILHLEAKRQSLDNYLGNYNAQLNLTKLNVDTLQGIQTLMEQVRFVVENNIKLIALVGGNTAMYNSNIDICNKFLAELSRVQAAALPGNYKQLQASDFCVAFDIQTQTIDGVNMITTIGKKWHGDLYNFSYSLFNVKNGSKPFPNFSRQWTSWPLVGGNTYAVWIGKDRELKVIAEPIAGAKAMLNTKFQDGYIVLG